jgi:hypothetical protein
MSGNIRYFLVAALVTFGSVFMVRSLAASPEPVLDDPPISVVATKRAELADVTLAEAIRRLAVLARAPKHDLAF